MAPYSSFLRLATAACLVVCASTSTPLNVLTAAGDGAFTFSLTGPANLLINSDDFWTNTYYVPAADKAKPVAEYPASALPGLVEEDVFVPFSVFATNVSIVTGDVLRELVASYVEDDVFTTDFIRGGLQRTPAMRQLSC